MDMKSIVRIKRPGDPLPNRVGKFVVGGRIQKLTASARELIESIGVLRRLLDYLSQAKQLCGFEICRNLRRQTSVRLSVFRELIQEAIQIELNRLVVEPPHKLYLADKIPVNPEIKFSPALDPPQLFIPIPNKTEVGGCARSDSLVHPLTF
jgi:hypothetical protein